MNKIKFISVSLIFILTFPLSLFSQVDLTDCTIKVTAKDSVGNFDLNSSQGQIVGVAYLSGSSLPDIFIQSSSSFPDFSKYKCIGRDASGTPIFGEKIKVTLPANTDAADGMFPSYIFQTADKKVHMVWYYSKTIRYALFDESTNKFNEVRSVSYGDGTTTGTPRQLTAYMGSDGRLHVVLGHITYGGSGVPADGLSKYGGSGVSRGKLGYVGLYEVSYSGFLEGTASAKRLVSSNITLNGYSFDVYNNYYAISPIVLKSSKNDCLIAGSPYGEISYYENTGNVGSPSYDRRKPIVNSQGQAIRHPAINPYPVAYPNDQGVFCDILASSEGNVCYYKFKGTFTANGNPVYEEPVSLLRKGANLQAGSLLSPNVVDWDGDGNLDIVTGNSQGFIYYYKNYGDNTNFAFGTPEKLKYKDGEPIFVQGGYGESTQGPVEARWGYTSPNIVDWDGDGHLDILMGDARSKHVIIKGSTDGLEDEESLYLNGLNFHGNWRDRPGIAVVGDSTVYITFDEDNNFHLYKKADSYNLIDGGKIKLADGTYISSDRGLLNAYNETGRAKFEIVDWDNDGLLDLLVGTTGAMAIPNKSTGLPQKSSLKKANVLYLKNVGTNIKPRYQFPIALTYKGSSLDFSWHECGVVATKLGGGSGLNLLVGGERGLFYLLNRLNLSNTATKYVGVPVDIISSETIPKVVAVNNSTIYSDKTYKLQDSISAFSSNWFTRINSANPASFYVRPKYAGLIYIATDATSLSTELSKEWKKLNYSGLKYGVDATSLSRYTVYYRESKEGEKVTIPQVGTLGSIVLSSTFTVGTDDPSGIENTFYKESKFKVYPNPARSSISIDSDGSSEQNSIIRISDILGKVIYSDTYQKNKKIDISTYSKGIYVITVGNQSMKLLIY